MQYVRQLFIISAVCFLGEVIASLIPLPIPASIYGIIILYACLHFHIIKEESIKDTSLILIGAMPVMFIIPTAGIMENWQLLSPIWKEFVLISALSTIAVFACSGLTVQKFLDFQKKKQEISVDLSSKEQ